MRELFIYFAIVGLVEIAIAELFLLWVVCKYGVGNAINTIPPERPKKGAE